MCITRRKGLICSVKPQEHIAGCILLHLHVDLFALVVAPKLIRLPSEA